MPKKKLSIFIPSMSDGGAERVMLNLAIGIAEIEDIDVDLVLVESIGPRMKEIPSSIRVCSLESNRIGTSVIPLARYLRKNRPDALLSALDPANLVAILAKKLARVNTRIIVTEHNTLSLKAKNPSKPRGKIVPALVGLFYPFADGIVAVSKGVADDLSEVTGIARAKIEVIYNPVITPRLRSLSRLEVEHRWFQDSNIPVVLGVGRLAPQKDFTTLIHAIGLVQQSMPVRLIILGEGELRADLEEVVSSLGLEDSVDLPGFVSNPYAYMSKASLFVLSSQWEGLPTVLIESLFCGTTLISTDCPSGPREILEDGRYGKIIPMEDAEALAQAIISELREVDAQVTEIPPASWKPYTLEFSVNHYLNYALGSTG